MLAANLKDTGSRSSFDPTSGPTDEIIQARIVSGQQIIEDEIIALQQLATSLSTPFAHAVESVLKCAGHVVVSGIGKAGIVGRKLSASLTSTGTRSHFLHPSEAVHGDLGAIDQHDIVLVLSNSGETEEITRLIPVLRGCASQMIAITASRESTLGKAADIVLELGHHAEACPLGLAPSTTTTAMLALCDALALVVSQERGFTEAQFARFHPAGSLGRQLTTVLEIMRPLQVCRVARDNLSVRQVMVAVSRPGRRTGAVMLVDEFNKLTGIFTDSDLARMLERCEDSRLDQPIAQVMTRHFRTIGDDQRLPKAIEIMSCWKISELPVVDSHGTPVGIIDLTDIAGIVTLPEIHRQAADANSLQSEDNHQPRIIPFNPSARVPPVPHQLSSPGYSE